MKRILLILPLTFLLIGCGGGGGGGSSGGNSNTPSTLSFHTFKGATNSATCALTNELEQELASGSTNAQGVFTTSKNISDGILILDCSDGTYQDEATGDTKMGTVMRAIVNYTGGNLTLTASPISEAIFTRAQALGGSTNDISIANDDIADELGLEDINVSLASVIPSDLNNEDIEDNNAGKIALVLAAVSQQNSNNSVATDTTLVVDTFVDSLISGTLDTTTFHLSHLIDNFSSRIKQKNKISTTTFKTKIGTNGQRTRSNFAKLSAINYSTNTFTLQQNTTSRYTPTLTSDNLERVKARIYHATGLPPGLKIKRSRGTIQGIPTTLGIHTATISAYIRKSNVVTQTVLFNVIIQTPNLANASNKVGIVDNAITEINFTNTGGNVSSCTVTPNLPTGLSVGVGASGGSCRISGIPTKISASANYTITGTNITGNSVAKVNITINPKAPKLSNISTNTIDVAGNTITEINFTNTGGNVSSCTVTPALPTGLSVGVSGSSCSISGIPTTANVSTTYTINGINVTGSDSASVNITINPKAPNLNNISTNVIGVVGVVITPINFTNTGGNVSSCAVTPTLPTGLSIGVNGGSCRISGAPTKISASANYTISGINVTGSDSANVNIVVKRVIPPNLSNVTRTFVVAKTAILPITFINTGEAPTTCSANPSLITGLSISPSNNTCVINGTPSIARSRQTYTITASNVAGNSSATIMLSSHNTGDLTSHQWHLNNTGQSNFAIFHGTTGADININGVTQTGRGVVVAVVDTGLEIAHEDLVDNVVPNGSRNFKNKGDINSDHGTSVAGIIGAKDNGIGPKGVAPNIHLKAFNYIELPSPSNFMYALGGGTLTSDVDIFNQSFSIYRASDITASDYREDVYKEGITSLRKGLGALYVKSAGNGFFILHPEITLSNCSGGAVSCCTTGILSCQNTNMDRSNTLPYQIVVGATNARDKKASYSTTGSSIWVSAPAGEYGTSNPAILTTDQSGCDAGYTTKNRNSFETNANKLNPDCNYTSIFNGTSSAAPVVSGVIALMLEANPNLTWRDVKHILANTSEKIDSNIANVTIMVNGKDYIAEPEWLTNAAGYNFHNYYGFGRVDAARAVASATAYVANSLGTLGTIAFTTSPRTSIPNFNASGITSVIDSTSALSVEAVNIFVNITHARSGELALELTSPNGTKSMILHPQNAFLTNGDSNLFTEFASNAFYGESARGNWTLKVVDTDNGNSTVGTLNSWTIEFYGH